MSIQYGLPPVIALLIFWAAWRIFFEPMRQLERSLSHNIREDVLPDVQRATTTLTTLSAAAVVLTVSVLQIWGTRGVEESLLMVLSWAGFTGSTLLGALILIGTYIYRAHYLVMTARMETAMSNEDGEEHREQLADAISMLKQTQRLERSVFVLLVGQPLIFTVSVCYLFVFAVHNI